MLFSKQVLSGLEVPFRPEFGSGGEDQDFFRRAMERGDEFFWCDEGIVHEFVPPSRWTRRFMLTRALLRGRNSIRLRDCRRRRVLRSIVALPLYVLTLPLFFILGHQYFMKYLIKVADHMGLLLGSLGIEPVRERPM